MDTEGRERDIAAEARDVAADLRDAAASKRDIEQAVETALVGGDDDHRHRQNRLSSTLDRQSSARNRAEAAVDRRQAREQGDT